jgi:AcrR family transcriptional regulator
MPRRDTRARLVRSAQQLFHAHGIQATSLAEVAGQAGVPVGNVYHHFRTKEALTEAVIAAHGHDILDAFGQLNAGLADPLARLRAFIASDPEELALLARCGCPYGTLCQELEKIGSEARLSAGRLLRLYLDWMTDQFRLAGAPDPEAAGLNLLSALQGAYALAHSLQSAGLLERQLAHLDAQLSAGVGATGAAPSSSVPAGPR